MKTISAIVPCFNEQDTVPLFYDEICRVAAEDGRFLLEMIFVDDGSRDGTLKILRSLAEKDERVRYISFSRNFGKESAMLAGLRAAKGDYSAILDADLQHPPRLLCEMFDILEKDPECDVVAARRDDRTGDSAMRTFFSKRFYRLINRISQTEIVEGAQDFRLMRRSVVDSVLSMGEYNRFSKGIFSWVGFNTQWITHENPPRAAGETTWSFWKLLMYSLDGIMAFSTKPLAVGIYAGAAFCVSSVVWLLALLICALAGVHFAAAWQLLACCVLFTGGCVMVCVGVLGMYLAKTYLEVKDRPVYIVRETEESRRTKER